MKKIISIILLIGLIIPMTAVCSFANNQVTSANYSADELTCNSYDVDKYTSPYWEGNIVYNEVIYPMTNESGQLVPFSLMYDASEIVSVKSYDLKTTYVAGRDYKLVNGKLVIISSGRIKVNNYSYIHPSSNPNNYDVNVYYPHRDGNGYEYWAESSEFSLASICVTYIHNDTWHSVTPENNINNLPKTIEKLLNKEKMNVVLVGDSVSAGAMSSGFLGISPYADAYPAMTVKALQNRYDNDNIVLYNSAVGGTTSTWTSSELDSSVICFDPDLVIIAYGMNDSSYNRVGISDEEFESNIRGRIEYIKRYKPDCEFLLLASVYGNYYTFPKEKYESHAQILHKIAGDTDGVGICDPQAIEKELLESGRKSFIDFMSDNMVHPNDMGMRLITQTIVESLTVDLSQYIEARISDLSELASVESHIGDGKYDLLVSLLNEATNMLNQCSNESNVKDVYQEYYEKIELVINQCAPGRHSLIEKIINPTCEAEGYMINFCEICGYEEVTGSIQSLAREHVWDEGRITTSPDYYNTGTKVYECAICGLEKSEEIPKNILDNSPDNVLHMHKGLNYMQNDTKLYLYDRGCLEVDVCPLDIQMTGDLSGYTSYFGLWIGGYAITAAYNFTEQRFEVVSASLPYRTPKIIYAVKQFDWDVGEWHKIGYRLTGTTINIYCDGELMLQCTNQSFASLSNVIVLYSIGEFNLDNFLISSKGYDLTTGIGTNTKWDLNSSSSRDGFNSNWIFGSYTALDYVSAGSNPSTGHYKIEEHDHSGSLVYTLTPTCTKEGWDEYICDICGEHYYTNYKEKLGTSHTLSKIVVTEKATSESSGIGICSCSVCGMTFTTAIPYVSVVLGDVNDDGKVNAMDSSLMIKYIAGLCDTVNEAACDINDDGKINSVDVVKLWSKLIVGIE